MAAVDELTPARVVRAWDETASLRGLTLDAPALAAAHAHPGQYVRAEPAPGVTAYFALANAPGEALEILVKRGPEVGSTLAGLREGDTVRITAPHGPGYPVEDHTGRDLMLFAAGSGIAPIRAVIQHVLRDRSRWGDVRLWHGQRRADEFAYAGEHAAWGIHGIRVVTVLSGDDPGWRGPRGRVQDALRTTAPSLGTAVAYVCGMKSMEDEVADTLVEMGMGRRAIFRNY